jgi:hypothetical protein
MKTCFFCLCSKLKKSTWTVMQFFHTVTKLINSRTCNSKAMKLTMNYDWYIWHKLRKFQLCSRVRHCVITFHYSIQNSHYFSLLVWKKSLLSLLHTKKSLLFITCMKKVTICHYLYGKSHYFHYFHWNSVLMFLVQTFVGCEIFLIFNLQWPAVLRFFIGKFVNLSILVNFWKVLDFSGAAS